MHCGGDEDNPARGGEEVRILEEEKEKGVVEVVNRDGGFDSVIGVLGCSTREDSSIADERTERTMGP